jgi:dTDP-4-amino-4,6-dideoxygalactose transaminase
MKKKGITLQTHYKPILQHTLYKKFINKKKNILNAINYYENSFSIPIFFNLKRKQQRRIIEEIKRFFL